jgi:DNA-directed RNA polymerase subunit M/transcription elongation factor TFIIS
MPICSKCRNEIDVSQFGYFAEGNLIYCEKCYADKRFDELKLNITAIKKWLESVKAAVVVELQTAQTDEEKKKVREKWLKKIPTAWEREIR